MLPIAMALAQFAPMIAGLFGGSKAEAVAAKVVGIAQTVTGQAMPDAALAALQADPQLAMQFQKAVLDQQAHLNEIAADLEKAEIAADVANTAAVNATMQVEDKSDHWPTYSWRPYVGFCYGTEALLAVIIVFVSYVGVMFFHVDATVLSYIPGMLASVAAIMSAQTVVLGVASYWRGKMQANPNLPTDNRG